MTESAKTMTYVAIAAVLATAGFLLAPGGTKVKQVGIDSLIGGEFYPKFASPEEATSIDVIGYDPVTATVTPFSVKLENGLWRIPTRHSYPADAKDRLSKVAASVIGIKREALAGRTEGEQADFQVLDPQAEKAENLKGIGNRVTLKSGNTVLADYIIGKAVPNRAGYYYVRKPDEKQTFIAKVELNLSTKFTDWIESDVLNLDGTKLTEIDIMKHSLEIKGQRAKLVGQERNVLTRKTPSDPWQLEGLDTEKEEVNQDEVRKLVTSLDDLKIVGVRPKPVALRKGLSDNEGITLDSSTEDDLASRGFFFQPTQRGGMQMISMEGDLVAGTDQAVEYEMHFGNVFEGTDEEIEFDFAKPKAESAEPAADKPAEETTDDDKPSGKKKSRYIFVTARVNPKLLGPELVEPTKPEPFAEKPAEEEKPAEKAPEEKSTEEKTPEAPKSETEDKPAGEKTTKEDGTEEDGSEEEEVTEETPAAANEEKPAEVEPTEEKPAEEKPAEEAKETPPQPPQVDPRKAYEDAVTAYELDLEKYNSEVKSREAKVKEAEEKVKTLNARFADWYYVISAESFETLRQGRQTLVKPKADAAKSETDPAAPTGESAPEETPLKEESPEKPADEKSAEEAPAEDKPKSEEPGTEKPAEETPPKSE